jgi:oxepin-CoA hydrolase / 3-oxo-5,6-dehydrosuberyl-CoA semialdehyde dehydrogenase
VDVFACPECSAIGELRWNAVVTSQDDEPVAAYDVLTLVAKQPTTPEET